jgi:hypothetical protein
MWLGSPDACDVAERAASDGVRIRQRDQSHFSIGQKRAFIMNSLALGRQNILLRHLAVRQIVQIGAVFGNLHVEVAGS